MILRLPPRKPAIFFSDRFMAARHEEWRHEGNIFMYVCPWLQRTIEWCHRRGKKGQRISGYYTTRPGTGFKTGHYVKKKQDWGSYRRTTQTLTDNNLVGPANAHPLFRCPSASAIALRLLSSCTVTTLTRYWLDCDSGLSTPTRTSGDICLRVFPGLWSNWW